ncbi:zinc ribbon domain-containing protein [Xenorhabdus thuongxuanensis]|uniref:Putative zinc-ribbon domain-containing protein n=1 Tax=Xenorhabdus thuongxuanensis TaxID=1873484 RepID=A0A1Q5U3T9_9GAMM|nr:zinc ribbon domain-containing protein [Xenorhabdus thuongxuanensis]OKP07115.1 hypothetical protein Xentx_01719 [Xenorhabdus thuongxuanensis]
MYLIVIAALLGLIPAAIASSKGREFFVWWLYGALIFIVALPHSLVIRKDERSIEERKIREDGMVKCPFCAEVIKEEAIKCKHCGSDIQEKMEEITLRKFKPSNISPKLFYKRRKDGIELMDERVKELSETLIKANKDKEVKEIEFFYQSEIDNLNKRLPKAIQKQFQDRYVYWLHSIKSNE